MTISQRWKVVRRLSLTFGLSLAFAGAFADRLVGAQTSDDEPLSRDARRQLSREIAAEVRVLEQQGNLLKKVVRLVKPAVVHIEAEKTIQPNAREFAKKSVEEAGSGVIIDYHDGYYVLTNRHVVKNAATSRIQIKFADGRMMHPTRVWSDSGTDVAVLALDSADLVAAAVGDSDQVEIGDFVLAVGSPFGLSHSVTYGIISATGRRNLQLGDDGVKYQNFFQTDAAINPGNSGGPLLNLRGEVIGINTAIASSSGGSEGIGFTIPINMAMQVVRQLIDNGAVTRAYLGVNLDAKFGTNEAVKLGLPRPQGALISGIRTGTPAADSELRTGDVIFEFDGVKIEDDSHLMHVVGLTPVGKEVSIVVYRQSRPVVLKVTLARQQTIEAKR